MRKTNTMDDNFLVRGCLQGEREEFQKIMEKYGGKVMAMAVNILGNREDAEDACQEAFIQAYLNLSRFNSRLSFSNWLYTILYNRCLDQLRKRRRFYSFFKKAKREHVHLSLSQTSNPSPAQLLPANALQKLSPKEKISLFLWANEGYTSDEIASVIKCSPSTARVYLFKARKKIKALLEKENVEMQKH